MSANSSTETIRLLVVARHPVRLEDLGVDEADDIVSTTLVRRPNLMADAIEETSPNVVLIDSGFSQERGFLAMGQVRTLLPEAAVLALTPDPPPHSDVARAANAGAVGFVDVDADASELLAAMRTVRDGGLWFPPEEIRPILEEVGTGLEMTAADRRSRLTGIVLGLIPLAGLLAALMAFLWRRYIGQIGVRPVDIAVDPASRVVDAISGMMLAIGVFGPLLFVSNWLTMLRATSLNRGVLAWYLRHRKVAHLTLSLVVLGIMAFASLGPDLLIVMVIGPMVAVAIIAQATDLGDQVPPLLRIQASPKRVLVGGVVVTFVFLAGVSGEALWVGPQFGTSGEGGYVVPRILGFNAYPIRSYNVNTGDPPRELLYVGGNADLYVLIDPCNDNKVEYVSVGAHKLEVIDEITCAATETSEE